MGSAVLGWLTTVLVEMGRGADRRETGDGRQLASGRVSALLALSFPGETQVGQGSPANFGSSLGAWPVRIPPGERQGFTANS
jgi:hypothetical protein